MKLKSKRFSTITLAEYFGGYRGADKADTLETLWCQVCANKITENNIVLVRTDNYRDGFYALCSESCCNMFILQSM